jgi:hypothetical protein
MREGKKGDEVMGKKKWQKEEKNLVAELKHDEPQQKKKKPYQV